MPNAVSDVRAAWLSDDVLVALVTLTEGGEVGDVALTWDGSKSKARFLPVTRRAAIVTSRLSPTEVEDARLELTVDGRTLAPPKTLAESATDMRALFRQLARLEPAARADALQFLATMPTRSGESHDTRLRTSLQLARDGLREPLPVSVAVRESVRAVSLDAVVAAGDGAFYLRGWVHDTGSKPAALRAVTPEGEHVDLRNGSFWEPRPDVDVLFGGAGEGAGATGFVRFVQADSRSVGERRWIVELRDDEGAGVEAAGPPVVTDPVEARTVILRDLVGPTAPPPELFRRHIAPAVVRVQERLSAAAEIERVHTFGEPPANADVSLVIPLGGRLDLAEYQLAHFAGDPELQGAEILYLTTTPAAEESVVPVARNLFDLYRIPFRLAVLGERTSLAACVNAAAAGLASGRLLALLDPAVIPAAPGFLGALTQLYDATPRVGAVGAKLLNEDDSLEHAGIVVSRQDDGIHATRPHRGMHRALPAANEPKRVDAVDGCLVVATDAFREVGGLRGAFLEEGYEYLDLCLRLRAIGRETWYAPGAEFYHLVDLEGRQEAGEVASRYDALLLATVLDDYGSATEDGPAALGLAPLTAPARAAEAPAVLDEQRPDHEPLVEMSEIVLAPPGEVKLLEATLERPVVETRSEYALTFAGRALGANGRVTAIQVASQGENVWSFPLNVQTPNMEQAHKGVPGAGRCGFRSAVSVVGLPTEFELEVEAVLDDGARAPLATVRGRRRRLRSGFEARLNPLFVTTLGRTGSSWTVLVLCQHPEIVGYMPFRYEPRVASYWIDAFRALSEPRSYMQGVEPELYDGHWWLGDKRPSPFRPNRADPRMPRWLGRENVESVARFCQGQIEGFYSEVAVAQGRPKAAYFVEKRWPDFAMPTVTAELYPGEREVLLVRDFRDMACSILAFNAKRGTTSFGRQKADTDAEFILNLRSTAARVLDSWRQRSETAHLLRYEDLILRPERTLAAVFDYLGVDASAPTIAAVLDNAQAAEQRGQQGHRTSGGPEESIGRWRADLDAEMKGACRDAFDDILVELGYEATEVEAPAS